MGSNYVFSSASEAKLKSLHPDLVRVVRRAMGYQMMDLTIIQTVRTPAEAAANLAKGTSATSHSKHLLQPDGFAHAVDMAHWPVDFSDVKCFGILMGLMKAAACEEKVNIRLGGNWNGDNNFHDNTPEDPGHFELA